MYVAAGEKTMILTAKKTIIKQENNQQIQTQEDDILNTLLYSIIKNFIGDPTIFQEKSQEILLNLTCRKLQDFRWYKDMFLTKVMLRPTVENLIGKKGLLQDFQIYLQKK